MEENIYDREPILIQISFIHIPITGRPDLDFIRRFIASTPYHNILQVREEGDWREKHLSWELINYYSRDIGKQVYPWPPLLI